MDAKEYLKKNVRLKEASDYAKLKHAGQKRRSNNNEDYYEHCFRVYETIYNDYRVICNDDMLIAALLHDVIEDTDATYKEVAEKFGPRVVTYLLSLTNTLDTTQVSRELYHRLNFDRIMKAPDEVKCIKLADMIDNLSDVTNVMKPEKAENYLNEKLEIVLALKVNFENRDIYKRVRTIIIDQYEKLGYKMPPYHKL